MPIRFLVATFCLLTFPAAMLEAQSEPAPGATVRGESCRGVIGCRRARGVVLAQRRDSLVLRRSDGAGATIPWTAADSVEILTGVRDNVLLATGLGAAVGLATGVTLNAMCSGLSDGPCPEAIWIGAGAGTVLGVVIGSLIKTEKWVVAPAPGAALRVGMKARF